MRKLFLVAVFLMLGACQSVPTTYYSPPTDDLIKISGSVVGSRVKPDNIFHDDETTFVLAVDGLPIKGGRGNYHSPVYIEPGKHTVQIANKQGTLIANVAFEIDIKSKEKYIARTEVLDVENVRIWIEDSSGERVTPLLVGARISGGSAVIPIFL